MSDNSESHVKMSGGDAKIVTCEWLVNDVIKTRSFPAEALSKHRAIYPETLSGKSLFELSKLWTDLIAGNNSQKRPAKDVVLAVGDVVSLNSGGPLMTIVAIGEQEGKQ